jgi:hypothetical protein
MTIAIPKCHSISCLLINAIVIYRLSWRLNGATIAIAERHSISHLLINVIVIHR